ncbi:hypothetical protein [Sphingobacterium luzhongxinii]|uniref:hypothetical protein n=1 Tax=Sphingobacterium luzhongxinii TaxID=2654181 RepID=UPI0013D942CD|nr:hypothetical protein [Sphingobacterium sp. xlx-73]
MNNRDQLRSLKQNIFNQNHSLQLSGGSKIYQYAFNGMYRLNRSQNIGSKDQSYGFNLRNNLRLLNGKLTASMLINFDKSDAHSTEGRTDSYDPYQMLFDHNGDFVYHYPDAYLNERMSKVGYLNNGVNLFQDAISSFTETGRRSINSDLKIDFQPFKMLKWANSFRISKSSGFSDNIIGAESSKARQLFNDFGVIHPGTDNVQYYIPVGDMFKRINNSAFEYRLNSGFALSKRFSQIHTINANIDFGLASSKSLNSPGRTLYGYNESLAIGYPLLAIEDETLTNFEGNRLNFIRLNAVGTGSETNIRSINMNGSFRYSFLNRYELGIQYLSSYKPNFGRTPSYSSTVSRRGSLSWNVSNEKFMQGWVSFVDKLRLTTSASSVSVPELPHNQISASRFDQTSWANTAININSFNYAEQSGQSNIAISAIVDGGFFKNALNIQWKFDKNSKSGNTWNGRLNYDIATSKYFKSNLINNLSFGLAIQNITPYAGMEIMMGANSVTGGGGTSTPIESTSGLLPPTKVNKELNFNIGILSNRYSLNARVYDNNTSGLEQGSIPADPSSGLSSKVNYSRITNRGVAVSISAGVLSKPNLKWRFVLNAAYNENRALEVPDQPFSLTTQYLNASRTGYTTDNIWSYNWAGLDTLGNPQYYSGLGEIIKLPDGTSVIYSGRRRAPYSGGLSTNLDYKGMFMSIRSVFNFGHVFRRYIPEMTPKIDRNIFIKDRWREPGDETKTNVPVMAKHDLDRVIGIQNASNTIMTADHIRITEIQLGYRVPPSLLKGLFVKGITISGQLENPFLWVRNDLGVDPEAISTNGAIGLARPKNYVMSISLEM